MGGRKVGCGSICKWGEGRLAVGPYVNGGKEGWLWVVRFHPDQMRGRWLMVPHVAAVGVPVCTNLCRRPGHAQYVLSSANPLLLVLPVVCVWLLIANCVGFQPENVIP